MQLFPAARPQIDLLLSATNQPIVEKHAGLGLVCSVVCVHSHSFVTRICKLLAYIPHASHFQRWPAC